MKPASKAIALLPGPPREMKPMMEQIVAERLRARSGGVLLSRRVLKIAGRSESRVEELTQPVYSRWREHEPADRNHDSGRRTDRSSCTCRHAGQMHRRWQ